VSKEGNIKLVSLEQPENKYPNLLTFAVLNELRSNELRDEQPWNIPLMSVTLLVLKLLPRVNDERFLQP
jgi:hypothetical protein